MSPGEVKGVLDAGARAGCTEALLCLGDRPERVSPRYRDYLAALGHSSTADYLFAVAELSLDRGLLPHTNAGLLRGDEMRRLKEVNASLGVMLESDSPRLGLPGQPHHGSPDKRPVARLSMIAEAGVQRIAFTTGILVGIGETRRERVESLLAIRRLHRQHGHIQEVIVQSFTPHPGSTMAHLPPPETQEVALTVAFARLILDRGERPGAPKPWIHPRGRARWRPRQRHR